jgi:apolipoprotein N-acyltransferase
VLIRDNVEYFSNGSQSFIVNISEDGWFGDTIGPAQIFQMSRMRAIENGVYLARVSNNGFTSIINNKGEVVYLANSRDENSVHPYDVPLLTPSGFYFNYGLIPWLTLWLGILIYFVIRKLIKR